MSGSVIHGTAIVSPDASIGDDVTIGPFTIVEANVEIGKGSAIGSHCHICHPAAGRDNEILRIGTSATIRPHNVFHIAFGMAGAIAAVQRRPVLGGLLILAGATFQSSEIVIGIGVAIALLLRVRLPVALLVCGVLAVTVQALIPDDPVAFLAQFNPLAQDYINQLDADVPNFSSVASITTMIVVTGMTPFVLLEREWIAPMAYIMSLMSVATFLALRDIPTFAHRFREIFAVFSILLVFAGRTTAMRQGLRIVMTITSLWLLSQYIADGLV